MDELKKCPFCGSDAEYYGECDMVWVRCSNYDCQAQRIAKFDEPEEAVEDWNNRHEEPMKETETANDVRRIDDLGRVVIPKKIREAIGITEGDELDLILYPSAGGVFIKPTKRNA